MTKPHERQWQIARSDMPTQVLWYLLVGGLSFLVDLAVFAAFLDLGVPVFAALVVGFVVGTMTNYVLSRLLAFTGGRYRPSGEIVRLFIVALIGLALTALLVFAFMKFVGMNPIAAKITATIFALGWNYFGRRLFVFKPEMPVAIWQLSMRAVAAARVNSGRVRPSAND